MRGPSGFLKGQLASAWLEHLEREGFMVCWLTSTSRELTAAHQDQDQDEGFSYWLDVTKENFRDTARRTEMYRSGVSPDHLAVHADENVFALSEVLAEPVIDSSVHAHNLLHLVPSDKSAEADERLLQEDKQANLVGSEAFAPDAGWALDPPDFSVEQTALNIIEAIRRHVRESARGDSSATTGRSSKTESVSPESFSARQYVERTEIGDEELQQAVQDLAADLQHVDRKIMVVLDGHADALPRSMFFGRFVWGLLKHAPHVHVLALNRGATQLESVLPALVRATVITPNELRVTAQEIRVEASSRGIELSEAEAEDICRTTMGWPALTSILAAQVVRDPSGVLSYDLGLPSAVQFFQESFSADPKDLGVSLLLSLTPFTQFGVHDAIAMLRSVHADLPTLLSKLVGRELSKREWSVVTQPKSEQEVRAALTSLRSYGAVVPVSTAGEEVEYSLAPIIRWSVAALFEEFDDPIVCSFYESAAQRLLDSDDVLGALRVAAEGKCWQLFARIVEQLWWVVLEYDHPALAVLIDKVPQEIVSSDPRLAVLKSAMAAWQSRRSGNVERRSQRVTLLEQLLGGGARATAYFDDRVLDAVTPENRPELVRVLVEWGLSRFLIGELEEAGTAFERTSYELKRIPAPEESEVRSAVVYRAAVKLVRGHCDEVAEALPDIDEAVAGSDVVLSEVATVVRGWYRASILEHCDCGGHGAALGGDEAHMNPISAIRFTSHNLCAMRAGTQRQALEHIGRILAQMPKSPTYNLVIALLTEARIHLLLSIGHLQDARVELRKLDSGSPYFLEARAREMYLSGNFDEASTFTRVALESKPISIRIRLALLTLRAAAEHELKREDTVVELLRQAEDISLQTHMTLYFAMLPQTTLQDFRKLSSRFADIYPEDQPGFVMPFDSPSRPDLLSVKEREVLVALGKTSTIAGTAKELFLGVNTVKTHLRNIYRKLDVHNIAEAIERGIELGIIERT
ncbi:LuxR C-terminal-related transcriptional regulator [Timonella sp. A28]|uniref:LuxR C-terminal-related transcriptional regulator n=1 Tax=Timonella sp. A28 TaxID=3442640 RepID=UPI003EBBE7D7